MAGFNLPPGCSVSDIPGNRPEDAMEERFWDELYKEFPWLDELTEKNSAVEDMINWVRNKTWNEAYDQAVGDLEEARYIDELGKDE